MKLEEIVRKFGDDVEVKLKEGSVEVKLRSPEVEEMEGCLYLRGNNAGNDIYNKINELVDKLKKVQEQVQRLSELGCSVKVTEHAELVGDFIFLYPIIEKVEVRKETFKVAIVVEDKEFLVSILQSIPKGANVKFDLEIVEKVIRALEI